jgi:hypothetical protein
MIYTTYFETGSLARGTKKFHMRNFRSFAAAKKHAAADAKKHKLCVTVMRGLTEVWAAAPPKKSRARPKKSPSRRAKRTSRRNKRTSRRAR